MTQQIATNVHWHHGEVTREDRNRLMGQKGATLWFTGLSGSGKSTVSVTFGQVGVFLVKVKFLNLKKSQIQKGTWLLAF